MTYKNIGKEICNSSYDESYMAAESCAVISHVKEWNVEAIGADPVQCGLSGSPTKVKKIQSVVLTGCESRQIANSETEITNLMHELVNENIIG